MKHFIDPTVDYVFKKLLGSKGNEGLLLDFINCIVAFDVPITKVSLLNPFTDREKLDDKLSVLDIKAEDEQGRAYQVEIQVTTPAFLRHRMLHNWAGVYHQQIKSGQSYVELRPVIAIWLLTESMFKDVDEHHLFFEAYDVRNQLILSDHLAIHVLELSKWFKPRRLQTEDYWLYFFKEGGSFKSLPPELIPFDSMRQAMVVLREISEQEEDYHRYQSRQEYLRVQLSETQEREALEKEKQKLTQEIEDAKLHIIDVKQSEAEAKQSAAEAKQSVAEAKQSAAEAKQSEAEAKQSEAEAKQSEEEAKQSEAEAKQSEAEAKQGEAEAKQGEAEAKQSEAEAKQSEAEAKQSEAEAKRSEEQAQKKLALMAQMLKNAGIDPP